MRFEQRVQVAAQQDTVIDNLRLGARVILDVRSLQRLVNITARNSASTSVGLKELSAKTLLTDSLATQRVANLFITARRSTRELRRNRSVLHVAHIGEEARVRSTLMNGPCSTNQLFSGS